MGEGYQSICRKWTANEDHTLNHHLLIYYLHIPIYGRFFPSFCDFISQFFPCFAMMHHDTENVLARSPTPLSQWSPHLQPARQGTTDWHGFMFHIKHLMEYINKYKHLWPIPRRGAASTLTDYFFKRWNWWMVGVGVCFVLLKWWPRSSGGCSGNPFPLIFVRFLSHVF